MTYFRRVDETDEFFSGAVPIPNGREYFAGTYGDSITAWMEPAESAVTLNGSNVAGIDDYRDGYGIDALQGTAAAQPAWQETGGLGGRPALYHLTGDYLEMPAGVAQAATDDFFKFVVFKSPSPGSAYGLIGTNQSDTGRHGLRLLASGNIVHSVGTNGTEALPVIPFPTDTWCIGAGSWDYSATKSRVALLYPGRFRATSAVNASAVVGTGAQYIGLDANQVHIALAVAGDVDILDPANRYGTRLLADLIAYCRDRFGIAR